MAQLNRGCELCPIASRRVMTRPDRPDISPQNLSLPRNPYARVKRVTQKRVIQMPSMDEFAPKNQFDGAGAAI